MRYLTTLPRRTLLQQTSLHIQPRVYHATTFKMSSSSSAQASQATPTKTPSAKEQSFIDSILKLYCLSPDHEAYSHYAEDAVFHDPVSIARGLDSIKSQFNGMPKIFARSETKSMSSLSHLVVLLRNPFRTRKRKS